MQYKRGILFWIIVFVSGATGGILATQMIWPLLIQKPLFEQYDLDRVTRPVIEREEIIIRENEAATRAIESVERTTVHIQSTLTTGAVIEGSGLILTGDGLIVTTTDRVPFGASFELTWEGNRIPFRIIKRDAQLGLALIKAESEIGLPTTGFTQQEPRLGTTVLQVGVVSTPEGLVRRVDEGIIAQVSPGAIMTNMQADATAAGSAIFDVEGSIFGIAAVDTRDVVRIIPVESIREFSGL